MSNPNEATIKLNEEEMKHLIKFFEAVTVSNMFFMLEIRMGRKEVDATAQAVVGIAGKIRASLDAAERI